jgi:hypothetical protein
MLYCINHLLTALYVRPMKQLWFHSVNFRENIYGNEVTATHLLISQQFKI